LDKYRRKSAFGNTFFSDSKQPNHSSAQDVDNTLLAYRVLKKISPLDSGMLG
jgi:hypothetical protein